MNASGNVERSAGTVKHFNPSKGYGFIRPDGGGADVFVHHSELRMEGFRKLEEGQRVEYTPDRRERGVQALDVHIVC